LDGALYLAPIPQDIHHVLDVGCGTGIWPIEFAEEHPNATVLGIDLSPIQSEFAPANCSFRVDNVEDDWVQGEDYDYIHSRAMLPAIKNWPRYISQAFQYVLILMLSSRSFEVGDSLISLSRHLKPGGYIELQDICFPVRCQDPEASSTSKTIHFNNLCLDMGSQMGLDLMAPLKWREHLLSAGFREIHMHWYNWPVGPWAKHRKNKVLGKLTFVDFFEGLDSAAPLFQRFLNWSSEETQVRIAEVKNEMKEQKIHLYQRICVCYAKKPGLLPAENSRSALSETATLPGPAPPPEPDMVVPSRDNTESGS
jgi:SAM-dependent methyltransferase